MKYSLCGCEITKGVPMNARGDPEEAKPVCNLLKKARQTNLNVQIISVVSSIYCSDISPEKQSYQVVTCDQL